MCLVVSGETVSWCSDCKPNIGITGYQTYELPLVQSFICLNFAF